MCELPWPQRDRCRAGLTGHRAHPGVGRSQNVGLLSVNSLTMLPLLDRDLQVASASGTWQRQCKSQEGHSCCWCLGPVNKQPKSEAVPISSTTDPACLIGPARVHLNHGLLCSEDLIHKTPLNCRSGSTGVSGSNARKPMSLLVRGELRQSATLREVSIPKEWYTKYQPIGFGLNSRSGSEAVIA